MSMLKTGIIIGGVLTSIIILFKTRFYRFFGWKSEFEKTSPLNHRVLYTIHVALYLLLAIFAFISFAYPEELSRGEGLAAAVTTGYSLFWLWRLVWQAVYFRPLIKGADRRKLLLHYALIVIFAALFIVYLAPIASNIHWR